MVVPVTVYVVVDVGETVAVAFVPAPLFHEYVVAPDAEIVVDCPAQIVAVPVAVTVGIAFTVMRFVCVDTFDPLALDAVSVTVYVPAVAYVCVGF